MKTSLPFKKNCSQLAGIGKKLVTVFAICSQPSTRTVLCSKTRRYTPTYQNTITGQIINHLSKLYRDTYLTSNICFRTANTEPWWLARRDSFSAKAPGHVNGETTPPTLSAHTRGPLAQIIQYVTIMPSRCILKVSL
jgi:hypothetical protein